MSKVNFVPSHGAILIELPEIETKTKGGIIKSPDMIEEDKKKSNNFFNIVAISDEEKILKVGMMVMCNLPAGSMVDIEESIYGLMPKHSILGYKPK